MRIRKNARPILQGGASSSFLVCQLNRSPWDEIDVTALQGDGDGFGVNTYESRSSYFADCIPPSDNRVRFGVNFVNITEYYIWVSLPSGESMELSFEYVEKPPPSPPPEQEREEDGFTRVVNNKPPLPPPGTRRRGRPRKHPIAVSAPSPALSDPHDFYYYSGFGPKWGKGKRGSGDKSTKNNYQNHEEDHENDAIGVTDNSSSTTQMKNVDEDDNNNKKRNKMSKNRNDNGIDMLDRVVDGELDYIEDESDEDGRRPRKLIKARSLKSLM